MALLVALVVAVTLTIARAVAKWRIAWRLAARAHRAAVGEARAAHVLRACGYEVLGEQVTTQYRIRIDDDEREVVVRCDFVVARGGRRFVAEVKTGRFAPRIETSATRRQLLEYGIAFGVDGVLLVDMEAERVHSFLFPMPSSERPSPWWRIATLVLLAVLVVIAARWF